MFLVEIRGAARTVRKRTGEEVSDPDIDWEGNGGEGAPAPAKRSHDEFIPYLIMQQQQQHTLQNPHSTDVRPEDRPAYVVGEASSTFTGDNPADEDDAAHHERNKSPAERLGASDAEALWERMLKNPRRFLRRLRAESSKRRIELTLSRPLEHGRAIAELVVSRGRMTIDLSIELRRTATGLSALDARKSQRHGVVTRLATHGTGLLAEDGTWSEVELSGYARNIRDASTETAELLPRIDRILLSEGDFNSRSEAIRRTLEPTLLGRERKILGLLVEILSTQQTLHVEFAEDRRAAPRDLALPVIGKQLASILAPPSDDDIDTTEEIVAPDLPALSWIGPREAKVLLGPEDEELGMLGDFELSRLLLLVPTILRLLSVPDDKTGRSEI